jgi:hypothetical protein
MATDLSEPAIVEDERLRRFAELEADLGPGWTDRFKPGTFGGHELLDRTAMVARLVEEAIVDHPACVQDAEWYALAERAAGLLHELYQRIGERHLDEPGEDDRP